MFLDKLLKVKKLLYPTGRAWRLFENNTLGEIHKAIAKTENKFWKDALSIKDSLLADNFNFTAEDAERWERRLGLPTNTNLSLQQRKLFIRRKFNHPGDIPGRQHPLYIQQQIQDAGFTNLYVHKNKFNGVAKSPQKVVGTVHGSSVHGGSVHGAGFGEVVIDYLDPVIDENRYFDYIYSKPSGFNFEPFYRKTFFIADQNLNYATIDSAKRRELRALILKLMPANMICFLITKYQ